MKHLLTILLIMLSISVSAQKIPIQDTLDYHLVGKRIDFSLLYAAIATPGDVTPNQLRAIAIWIATIKPVTADSIIKPKKPIK